MNEYKVIRYNDSGDRTEELFFNDITSAAAAAGSHINGARRSDPTIWERRDGDYSRLTCSEIEKKVERAARHAARVEIRSHIDAAACAVSETDTPAAAAALLIAKIGHDAAAVAVAELVNTVGTWDGRIYSEVRAWASSIDAAADAGTLEALHVYQPDSVHPAHINQLAQAMAAAPEDDETTAGGGTCSGCKYSDACGDPERVETCDGYQAAGQDDETPAEEPMEEVSARLHVSARNSKLGRVPNMSLAPVKTCSACACKTCAVDGCYALKSYRLYPETRRAWDDNTALALQDLPAMERGFMEYFQRETTKKRGRKLRFFRIHVGGDFCSVEYARMWFRVALAFPEVKFLAFTKQFDIVRPVPFYTLKNFSLRLSDWPGTTIPEDLRRLYRVAWMDDGSRPADTFPANVLECPGNCENCGACWGYDGDTLFHKH